MADVPQLLTPPVAFLFANRLYRAEIAGEPDRDAALPAVCLDAETVEAEARCFARMPGRAEERCVSIRVNSTWR